MKVKVKRTGVEWEVPDGSPTAIRVKAQPDDYEVLKDVPTEDLALEKPKKEKGPK
jgi:hypothetical protein